MPSEDQPAWPAIVDRCDGTPPTVVIVHARNASIALNRLCRLAMLYASQGEADQVNLHVLIFEERRPRRRMKRT